MSTDNTTPESAVCGPEQYHGDLRKGAYLRRRADYQMQAGGRSPVQAGTLAEKEKEGS